MPGGWSRAKSWDSYSKRCSALVEAMPELILKDVKAAARDAVMPSFRGTFEIKAAELADDATVLGAAAWARHVAGD